MFSLPRSSASEDAAKPLLEFLRRKLSCLRSFRVLDEFFDTAVSFKWTSPRKTRLFHSSSKTFIKHSKISFSTILLFLSVITWGKSLQLVPWKKSQLQHVAVHLMGGPSPLENANKG